MPQGFILGFPLWLPKWLPGFILFGFRVNHTFKGQRLLETILGDLAVIGQLNLFQKKLWENCDTPIDNLQWLW